MIITKDKWGEQQMNNDQYKLQFAEYSPGSICAITINPNIVDIESVASIIESYAEAFPQFHFITLFDGMTIEILDKNQLQLYIDSLKNKLEEKTNE